MKNQVLEIKANEFGIEPKQANELTTGLNVVVDERKLLIEEFERVSKLEITEENIEKFKGLRLRFVKNRTQGINKWHNVNKEVALRLGQFLDAIKRSEISINEKYESLLMDSEKFFENQEKERLQNLQNERVEKLSKYLEDAEERNLSIMEEDVWCAYLATKKKDFEAKIEAEKKAEAERIAKDKAEAERIRLQEIENAKLKAEAEKREKEIELERKKQSEILEKQRLEAEKIRVENEAKLKAEREARERVEKEERLKREKLEAEIKAKEEAEIKAKEEEAAKIESELNKGDSEKVKDLINELELIKTKYSFKSKKNQKMYSDVFLLIDKVINHIK